MKNLIYCIVCLFLIACTSPNETVFTTQELGNYYEVSIPKFFDNGQLLNTPEISYWHSKEQLAFLNIYFVVDNAESKMQSLVNEQIGRYKDIGFYCSKENLSDTTTTIKFSKGMLYGKNHLVIRKVELGYYIVMFESSKGCSFEDALRIASSIKLRIKENKQTETQSTKETKYAVYTNNLFSVSYPSEWSLIEKPDEMSDVYIGSNVEEFYLSILHFDDLGMTLKEIIDISNSDLKSNGLSVIKNQQTKVAGYDAYETIFEGEILGVKTKYISYSFLTEKGTFYNIKFGHKPELIDKNSKLISRILKSFKLKDSKPQIQHPSISLTKTFGNQYFSLNYPSNWEIVNEDANTIRDIDISVQVMQKRTNETDFLPNVNIIRSPQKRIESTQELTRQNLSQIKQALPQVKEGKIKSIEISGCKGSSISYSCKVQGYLLEWYQYIVKKSDNTTYTITCTIEQSKRDKQKTIVDAIVNSCIIK